MNVDMTGWRPAPGQLDRYGREIPDKLYGPREYERVLAILDRTEEAGALYLDKPDEVERFDAAFEAIWDTALDERSSRDLIGRTAEDMRDG